MTDLNNNFDHENQSYVYIHGFNSFKNSSSLNRLQKAINKDVYGPGYDSSAPFSENIESLIDQVQNLDDIVILGSSLGGFYAEQLQYRLDRTKTIACIMFNPVIDPVTQLRQFLGKNTNFATGKEYYFSETALKSYVSAVDTRSRTIPRVIYLAEEDEVLDSNLTREYWKDNAHIIEIKGGHQVEDYQPFAREILTIHNIIWL